MVSRPRRRPLRLTHFDYATHGAYFVTVCAHQRRCIFGDVDHDAVRLAEPGEIVEKWWAAIPSKFPDVEIDRFVVMPNHVHGILWIIDRQDGGVPVDANRTSLPRIMQWFKTMSTNEFIRAGKRDRRPSGILWQRNYWERVIRDERSLDDIRLYIENNPRSWAEDDENPDNRASAVPTSRTSKRPGRTHGSAPTIHRRPTT